MSERIQLTVTRPQLFILGSVINRFQEWAAGDKRDDHGEARLRDLAERFHSEKAGSESWQVLNTLTGYIARREYETQGNSPPKHFSGIAERTKKEVK